MTTYSVRDLLLIHWRGPEAPLDWLRIDGDGRIGMVTHERAPPQSVLDSARQIVVLTPSEQVTLLSATLPTRRMAQARQAAPFAIEEQLATAVDNLEFAVAPNGPERWWVAALEAETLRTWVTDLKLRGIVPDRLLPEVLALPPEKEGAVVLTDSGRALIRIGTEKAFATELDLVPTMLQASGIDNDAIVRLHTDAQNPAIQYLAAGLRYSPELNLLSGEFAPQHRSNDVRAVWRHLAWLCAAVLIAGFAFIQLDQIHLAHRLQALNSEMERLYRERFPDARQVPNPLAQMQSALKTASGGVSRETAGLGLLAQSAPIIATQSRVVLTAADYRNGVLTLQIIAPDVQILDGIRESLGTSGSLKATLENASTSNGSVDGRIKIEAVSKIQP